MPTNEQYLVAREVITSSLGSFLPEILLAVTICSLFLMDLIMKGRHPGRAAAVSVTGLVLTGLALVATWPAGSDPLFGWKTGDVQHGLLGHDAFAWFFKALILLGTLVVIPMVMQQPAFQRRRMGEFHALLLGATLGMFLMAGAENLLMVYLGVEFASMGSYLLTSFVKRDLKGSEAGLKYVIYGSVASGVMVFGLSFLYGMTGSLQISDIAEKLVAGGLPEVGLLLTGVMVFGGFAYKMAAFPMHFWCPDVYEGAPTPVTAYLSVASKAAGFAVFVRFLMGFGEGFQVTFAIEGGVLDQVDFGWPVIIAAASALSMTVGNLAALWQTNVKRMLAYSSVAHAGYLLMGVVVLDPGVSGGEQFGPLIYYFIAYFVMNLGAFYIVNLIASKEGREDLEGYRDLGSRSPWLAAFLVIFLLSLLGIPPTGGFVGKLQLFMAVIDKQIYWLAVLAGVNSAISAYYYFKLLKAMYLETPEGGVVRPFRAGAANMALLGFFALLVLVLGVAFSPVVDLVQNFSL